MADTDEITLQIRIMHDGTLDGRAVANNLAGQLDGLTEVDRYSIQVVDKSVKATST